MVNFGDGRPRSTELGLHLLRQRGARRNDGNAQRGRVIDPGADLFQPCSSSSGPLLHALDQLGVRVDLHERRPIVREGVTEGLV